MNRNNLVILLIIFLCSGAGAQMTKINAPLPPNGKRASMHINTDQLPVNKDAIRQFDKTFTPAQLNLPLLSSPQSIIRDVSPYGLPTWIEGPLMLEGQFNRQSPKATFTSFMVANTSLMKIAQPGEEFILSAEVEDEAGRLHHRYQQYYKGVEVWNAEVMLHFDNGTPYLFNGRFIPTPVDMDVTPAISQAMAIDVVTAIRPVQNFTVTQMKFLPAEPVTAKLVIHTQIEKSPFGKLAYHVVIHPDLVSRYEYFVDAQTGEVLDNFKSSCAFYHDHNQASCSTTTTTSDLHIELVSDLDISAAPPTDGPFTAQGTDLNGVTRTIHTYQVGTTFLLIDGSRPMFGGATGLPDNPKGAIWTIDATNSSPENENFQVSHVTSNNNTWNKPASVSAHFNGGIAYDYFRTKFNRNSINGQGGTIISIINVAEKNGGGLDNAFWNGSAMFYGNGAQAFKPLAGGLDVAGHEMSHGVIQATANLTYQNESGALNESFADIFGVLIDRDNYQLGEDIVRPGVFPSGAMRDVSNPHNGGNSLSDNGYQPAHMNEKYNGTQDNGGVHINSGIVNFAFYKVASALGKDDAEKIYYNALSKYLTKSSQFIDCRNAVIQAAKDLYGAASPNIAAIESAYSAVGIGAGPGTTVPEDYEDNTGQEVILFANDALTQLWGVKVANSQFFEIPNSGGVRSKPSVSDNGAVALYVTNSGDINAVIFNWSTNNHTLQVLANQDDWRNVAISKDGTKAAAILNTAEPYVYIFDLLTGNGKAFELYNPTTGTGGIFTGDVQYADALEFDHTGQFLMYDAFSQSGFIGTSYWDIGFLNVWNPSTNNFGDGSIEKLFGSLPNGISVGNPVFSKNSPYIIAFDYLEHDGVNESYALLGGNIENGDIDVIFENGELSYPCYTPDDEFVIFNAKNTQGAFVIAGVGVNTNKISPLGDPGIIIENATWGNWFATGQRILNDAKTIPTLTDLITVTPSLASSSIQIDWNAPVDTKAKVRLLDINSREMLQLYINLRKGENHQSLNIADLPAGVYFLEAQRNNQTKSLKVIKM